MDLEANGSNGSSSSSSSSLSPGRKDERNELEVTVRGISCWSGTKGAAIARLELALRELCAQRPGDGGPDLKVNKGAGFEEAAESGRWIGLNSDAFAFRRRGEDKGEDGRLAVN